jgi:DNA polymerase
MKPRSLIRYGRDLGWCDPLEVALPDRAEAPEVKTPAEPAAPVAAADSLEALAEQVQGCTACRLSEGRRKVVFGEGGCRAGIMFIGEGPGAEEDRTGRPFVGQAGQLLDGMIRALGLDREAVYIANVVKCRPPGNRDPEAREMTACTPILDRQVDLLAPKVMVALGRVAAQRLTATSKPISALRGSWTAYRGIPLLPTFHPAYLLRNPTAKRAVWQDLKRVREKLKTGSEDPLRGE